ncbi:MAG: hypothetical protein EBZ78_04150 [Verrucomicrobia bacterium]|nr:hypothetical protein [Verrucomicrobiota bacterium]
MTAASTIDWAGANYARQVDEIRAEVEKRYWVLRYDEQLKWHYVEDGSGRRLCEPQTLPMLRGWVARLPPQA